MAFTAYIFQEDCDRLTRQEIIHASQHQKGGSLFGQWTSTGNPVIHRALSFSQSQSDRDAVAKNLYEAFRVCYIGEWQPAQAHTYNDIQAREARDAAEARERSRGRDVPARFLVLNVSRADIVPFLFNRPTAPPEKGRLERLPGENPFNKRESFEQPMRRRDYDYQHALAEGQQNFAYQAPRAAQFQEAVTANVQWYSGDKGNTTLQKVLEDIKKIAVGDVDMSRDTKTHDISLSFTDNRKRKKWEIRFPPTFPAIGAFLIENPGSRQEKRERQSSSDKASKAVGNIIYRIQNSSLI